jgi:branched-chain amino acid transport system substrate-binding protein
VSKSEYDYVDADNHFYEAPDAFYRRGTDRVKHFVQSHEQGRKKFLRFGGARAQGNAKPTFNPVASPARREIRMRLVRTTAGRAAIAVLVVACIATACGSSKKSSSSGTSPSGSGASSGGNKASAPGVTPTAVKIGFITSVTGNASSTFSTSAVGAKAYFDAINKQGGIAGRQVQLVTADDTSSPSGALTAVQILLNQGVFAIISDSSFFFGAYRAVQQAGVPVIGSSFDGPEWSQQPNTNMFSLAGGTDPNHPQVFAAIGAAQLAKYLGVKNVGGLAYGSSPSATAVIKDIKSSLSDIGVTMGYENLSVAFGTSDVTAPVLAMKQARVDFAVCACVQSTVLALVTGLKQSGDNAKSLSLASADSTLFSAATAAQAAQGVYYSSIIPPLDTNNGASNTFQTNLQAADPSYVPGSYPTFGTTDAYIAAVLMAKGLQVAGENPTRQSFITNLTKVTAFDADGLLPSPVSFNHFGTSEKTYCSWYVTVQGQKFVSVNNGKALCGTVPSNL